MSTYMFFFFIVRKPTIIKCIHSGYSTSVNNDIYDIFVLSNILTFRQSRKLLNISLIVYIF